MPLYRSPPTRDLLFAREPGANAGDPGFRASFELLLHDGIAARLRVLLRWLPKLVRHSSLALGRAQRREFWRMFR